MKAIFKKIVPYLKFRYLILSVFLYFSCYLLVHYMTSLINNPAIKTGVSVFTVVLDVGMQVIILARAKQNWATGEWKRKQWKKRIIALILFAFYAIYLIFFAILSAVGFFMVEVQKTETEIAAIQETFTDNRDRLKEISEELKAWNIQLATEGKTGYGGNSKEIKEEIRKLKADRAEIEAINRRSLTVKQESVKSAVNSFEVLSKKLGVKRDNLETLIFGIAVIMLYVFIIMLTESGMINQKKADNSPPQPPLSQPETLPETPVTGNETGPEKVDELPPEPELNDYESKFIAYVEELYRGIDDSKIRSGGGPVELNSLLKVRKNLRGIVSDRKCHKFKNTLNDWGAIVTNNGINSLGMWPKAEIIEKIRSG